MDDLSQGELIILTAIVSAVAGWWSELVAHPAIITAILGPLTAVIIQWIQLKREERKTSRRYTKSLQVQVKELYERELKLKDELIELYEAELPADTVKEYRKRIAKERVDLRKAAK